MKATPLIHERRILGDNAFVELRVWQVPEPLAESQHSYKYRLALVVDGVCVL